MRYPISTTSGRIFTVLFALCILTACGGGGPTGDSAGNYDYGWVLIENERTGTTGASIDLYGEAFSDTPASYTPDNCPVGPDTSMTIKWTNQSSSTSGYGYLGYWVAYGIFRQAECQHRWSATVPLISGKNVIVITVSSSAVSGSASIDIRAPLNVLSALPLAGAINVPVNSTISATFNGQIDPQSVTPSSFQLVSGSSGTIAGVLTLSGSTVTFTPGNNLGNGITYTAAITPALKDTNGVVLAQKYVWRFTTYTPHAFMNITLPYWGTSALGDSYYRVSGLVPLTTYNVNIIQP
jgi:hypothetical protein